MTPTRRGLWVLFVAALLIVVAWPPRDERSVLVKLVNWAVDPTNVLPILPPQLGYGLSDDPHAVEERDAIVRQYDDLYSLGGVTRARLQLKVAGDPFNRATERQVLLLFGVVVTFVVVRTWTK